MQIIDLTHPLTKDTPVYPSDPPFSSTPHTTLKRDGYNLHRISCSTHIGTHLDAPFHFHESGDDVGRLEIEKLFGEFVIVDLEDLALEERQKISWETVESRMPTPKFLKRNTIVLIHTSWCSRTYDVNDPQAYFSHPYLCPSIAQNLISIGITVVGVDIPSPDETPRADGSTKGDEGFAFHDQFLGSGGVIVENLTNLGDLIKAVRSQEGKWFVSLVPLKLDGLDGSPIRAFAVRMSG